MPWRAGEAALHLVFHCWPEGRIPLSNRSFPSQFCQNGGSIRPHSNQSSDAPTKWVGLCRGPRSSGRTPAERGALGAVRPTTIRDPGSKWSTSLCPAAQLASSFASDRGRWPCRRHSHTSVAPKQDLIAVFLGHLAPDAHGFTAPSSCPSIMPGNRQRRTDAGPDIEPVSGKPLDSLKRWVA